MGAAFVG